MAPVPSLAAAPAAPAAITADETIGQAEEVHANGTGKPGNAFNREIASLVKAQQVRQNRLSGGSSHNGGGGGGMMPDPRKPPSDVATGKSPNCSTYHTSFNMRDDYPEMFAE